MNYRQGLGHIPCLILDKHTVLGPQSGSCHNFQRNLQYNTPCHLNCHKSARRIQAYHVLCVHIKCSYITLPHLCLRSQHNPELAEYLNEGHLCLQHCKSHSNAASWTVPEGHVSTRMTLGLLFRTEPDSEWRTLTCGKCIVIIRVFRVAKHLNQQFHHINQHRWGLYTTPCVGH